ncbi:type IV pilin protein [Chitinolyticbacter meiyuanensis]|uniref:type IV pilin protein n=1 Tax=Chitinolyticbacter meiyuanensis TaxID=682798 RepID=UPI0011E58E6A|nr:type IV pilin protein [Chitinolyticbacter meiyuanensis]
MHNDAARRKRGFTLLELIITVAIIGILAAIAIPSYQRYVLKTRRADAQTAMHRIAQAQEKWRANNTAYTNSFANLGVGTGTTLTSESGYYDVNIYASDCAAVLSSGSAYCIKAAAKSAQLKDSGCTSLTMVISNGNTTTAPSSCWSK